MRSPRQVIAAILLSVASAGATSQPRDGGLSEQRSEEAASECLSSPECLSLLRTHQAQEARRQADYEQKPFMEKAIPWGILLGVGYLGYRWWTKPRPKQ